ncbi:MAG TPA: FHA domain-containing protein [Blastocatellia bacterium]|nr:FHA domain-containing protein [Blastocatellia bacterium]HMV83641.1 FHA domain-containing protein [Blastocatellia bacterium]HMX29616.1 FHA domain-containing protein [Blastocatellia bacterium]HMZ20779.1 FHA domain-containing protein [Blastocatellia bacterium]HNG34269.1 FHA domain-containing protein [Blastocatellia bacterium]
MDVFHFKLVLLEKDHGQPADLKVGDSISVSLDEADAIYVGRAPEVDVLVHAPTVGRRVIRLFLRPEGLRVEDLGSGGGSALEINGLRLSRPNSLVPDQSVLWIGGVAFRVEFEK